MPKENIDYSNTIIYKIYCNDSAIKDIYVGHTTHFIQRKYQHKLSCNNLKNVLKIYKTIRENGGWNNWSMVEIAKYNCNDSTEARIKEQLHYEELHASLNSCPPYANTKKYVCVECDLQCSGPTQFNNHINCISHNKKKINPNNEQTIINKVNLCTKFVCKTCDYSTSRKSQLERHLVTPRHIIKQNETHMGTIATEKCYDCNCGDSFNSRTTLWRHKKKCIKIQQPVTPQNIIVNISDLQNKDKQQELIEYLLKENSEFKQLMIEQNKHMMEQMNEQNKQNKNMMELAKNSGNNNNSHNTTNNNNFNLQFFLNETCKDAMNIMEFVDQLQVSVKDLEETGRLGYSEGISKIFINGLKQINISDRPIHCSDSKREIVYIKDKNQWNKEDGDKSLLTNAIKRVAHKNMKQIKEWTKVNPEYNDSSSKQNDRYLKIVSNSMNGLTEEEANKNYNKIIKNITKETVIDK